MFCPNCGVENQDNAVECRRCRAPFTAEPLDEGHVEPPADAHESLAADAPAGESNDAGAICGRCGTFNEPGVERCTNCGYPLAHAHADEHGHEAAREEHAPAHDEPALAHDDQAGHDDITPAEGNPSLSDEVSALAISPEDAREAHEDATPAEGHAAVAQEPAPAPEPVRARAPAAPAPSIPAAPAASAEKICASCNTPNLPNAKFCAECGTPFAKRAPAPAPAPAPIPTPAPASAAAIPAVETPANEPSHAEPAYVETQHEEHNDEPTHAEPIHDELVDQDQAEAHEHTAEHAPAAVEPEEPLDPLSAHESGEDAPAEEDPYAVFEEQKTDPSQRKARPRAAEQTAEHAPIEAAAPEHGEEHAEEYEHAEAPAAHEEHEQAGAYGAPAEEEGLSVSIEAMQPLEGEAQGEAAPETLPEEQYEASAEPAAEGAAAQAEEPVYEEAAPAAEEPAYEEPPAEPPYSVQLVVEKGELAGTAFHLAALENSIGGAGAAIEMQDDVYLAPHHATVYFDEHRLLLRDEGAVNGVFIKLRDAVPLEPGDQFIAGERLLRFDGMVELPAPEEIEPPFQGSPRPQGQAVRVVELLSGGKPGRSCHRAGPVIAVGKSGCDMNFPSDTLLAARHAEIHLDDNGAASLVDLGAGEAGVLLRLQHGAAIELQAGDVLQLGAQTLRVELA